jgi:hypothetical protein
VGLGPFKKDRIVQGDGVRAVQKDRVVQGTIWFKVWVGGVRPVQKDRIVQGDGEVNVERTQEPGRGSGLKDSRRSDLWTRSPGGGGGTF